MSIQTVEINTPDSFAVVEIRQGPAGEGGGGSNSITSATTSDGTANLSLSNVTTATAEVTGTLTAPHIHGNLAGSLYAHVRAAENLAKGDPVYVSGSHGSGATLIAEVSKADASNAAKMPAVGIMDAAVSANATGHMVISGTITELATNAYSINAELYVAAGGGMTATPPTARAQPVARVERSNANNGAILVKVNGLSASDATGNTLVRRTSDGSSSLNALTLSGTGGSPFTSTLTGGVNFANRTLVLPDASGTLVTADTLANSATITASTSVVVDTIVLRDNAGKILVSNMDVSGTTAYASTAAFTYGTGAALAHRTALGSGATGDELFQAVSPAAARETLELGAFSTNGSITGTGALTFTSAAASNINLTPGTTGFVNIVKASSAGVRESILRARLSDAGDDTFQVYNGTVADGRFSPAFGGAAFSNPGTFGLLFNAVTNAANDTGSTPMMLFAAGRTSSTSDPFNGTFSDISTRPLFRWQTSGNNLIAEISAARNLSIFTTTASTSTTTGALVVSGGVGIAGAVNSLYQRVGSDSPEGVVTAPVGAVFHRTNGGAGTSFYVKESGAGNTGWVAK